MNVTKIANKVLNSGFVRKIAPDNATDIAAKIALISTTSKDALNCYYYTTQSWNNEKIPEENRKFVALMDFMNGVLNVSIQFLMGTWVERKSSAIFDRLFGKHFGPEAAQKLFEKAQQQGKNFSLEQIADRLKTNKKWGSGGFKVLAVLAVTQVFCKRVITPLFATPLAAWLKGLVDKKNKPEASSVNTDNKVSEQNQSAETVAKNENVQFAGYNNLFLPTATFQQFNKMINK